MGPPFSCDGELHIMPVRETSPWLVAKPARLLRAVGITMEAPVSLPRPMVAKQAAMAAPVPELEAPVNFFRLYGLKTWPFSVLAAIGATAYQSAWLSLPKIIAPAELRRLMMNESLDGCDGAMGLKPPDLGISKVL